MMTVFDVMFEEDVIDFENESVRKLSSEAYGLYCDLCELRKFIKIDYEMKYGVGYDGPGDLSALIDELYHAGYIGYSESGDYVVFSPNSHSHLRCGNCELLNKENIR